MKKIINRAKYVVTGEEGSIIEWVLVIAVVLALATLMFVFKDSIKTFITEMTTKFNGLNTD